MNDNQPFKLGVIGCGSYSAVLADAAAKSPELKLVACYDIDGDRMRAFAENHGAEPTSAIQDLLSRDDVQGVIVTSPNNAHRENVEMAAEAGKHVFVDKPIANTIKDAVAMIDAAERAGVVLAVGHNGRRHAGHRKMKQMIDAGVIGMPVMAEANFSHAAGLGLTPDQWRFYKEECPALPLMQLGVHFADTMRYLLGDVTEVSSFMSRLATPADNYDVTVSLLKFAGGVLGYLGSNYASPPAYYINVFGTGGNLYCESGNNLRLRRPGSDVYEEIPVTRVDTQRQELEEFARCAITGDRFEVDGEAALKSLAIIRAAMRSQDEGCSVGIDEVILFEGRGNVATTVIREE